MIQGSHLVIYSKNAEADRAFVRDVLGFGSVDAGQGWLIFALPPGEVAFHPSEESGHQELYLMCEDLDAAMAELAEKGVDCGPTIEAPWGVRTAFKLPGGAEIGLYQPRHPLAIGKS